MFTYNQYNIQYGGLYLQAPPSPDPSLKHCVHDITNETSTDLFWLPDKFPLLEKIQIPVINSLALL